MNRDGTMIIEGRDLVKRYRLGEAEVNAVNGISRFCARAGESIALLGRSGSGKSSLLHMLGGLERPTEGTVHIDGLSLYEAPESQRARLRAERIGFVFQAFHLVSELTAHDNIELVMRYISKPLPPKVRASQADVLLAKVGLDHRRHHRVTRLSGGERQRVAIARALANDPGIIIADEPTGNLDSATGDEVLELLFGQVTEGRTLIVATHSVQVAERCGKRCTITDGRLEEDA